VAWRLTVAIGSTAVFRRFPRLGALAGKMHFALAPSKNIKGATLRVLRGLLALMACLAFSGCMLRGPEIPLKPPIGGQSGARGLILSAQHAKKANC
jgi:hypothetical protein